MGFQIKKKKIGNLQILNSILGKNFNNIENNNFISEDKEINIVKEFEHNSILLVDGKLISNNFDYEDKDKISIKDYNYKNEIKIR